MTTNGRDSLLHDWAVETAESIRAMSWAERALLAGGLVGFVVFTAFHWRGLPHPVLATLRVVCFVALLAGTICNARVLDEFYQRVYLLACAYTLVVSSVVLYALSEFGVAVGPRAVAIVVGTWTAAFFVAFAVVRRG